jgi:hypothetical protein
MTNVFIAVDTAVALRRGQPRVAITVAPTRIPIFFHFTPHRLDIGELVRTLPSCRRFSLHQMF